MWKKTINLFIDAKVTKQIQDLTISFIHFCKTHNERLSQRIASIIVRIHLINTEYRFVLNDNVTSNEKQSFLKVCYDFLFSGQNISSITIKMQCLFHGRYLNREIFKDHQKHLVIKNCYHLVQKLKKSWHNPTEDFKELHNDLVQLILIKEGMADEEDPSAFDEMRTAINSIFPPSALSTFVVSNQKTKMAFINEISSIAAGIRLHAWYGRKAGKFMFDVGKIMKETLPKINEDLYEEMSNISEKVEDLQEKLKGELVRNVEEEAGARNDYDKLLLIFLKNYYKFIKVIKEGIQEVAVQTYKLDYTFNVQLRDLDSAMNTGPFSKADKVYPFYKDIARTWKSIQLEGHLLNYYSNLYQEMKTLSNHVDSIKPEKIIEIPFCEESSEGNQSVTKVLPDDIKNFDNITLEYQEFCTYYCSMGILMPCNKDLGIIMYKNLCYGFSSIEAMEQFTEQPADCIRNIKLHILAIPELIVTLQVETYFNFPLVNTFKSKRVLPVFISNSSTQTVLHPIEKKIDYTYNWNQWNLRKNALQYVDLLGKKTHSTQTNLSNFRRENHSQVYLPRDQSTQTKKDASTNLSKAEVSELYIKTKATLS